MPREGRGPAPAWEDAKFAVQEIGGWVKNADAKITILAAMAGVTVTLLASRASDLSGVIRLHSGTGRDAVLVTAVLALLSLSCAAVFIVRALNPRYSGRAIRPSPNRFSWPELAASDEDLIPDPQTAAVDAWAQARSLAAIASAKYRNFRWALGFFLAGVAATVSCLGTTAWVLAGL